MGKWSRVQQRVGSFEGFTGSLAQLGEQASVRVDHAFRFRGCTRGKGNDHRIVGVYCARPLNRIAVEEGRE